jgi:hypothetical protein
MLTVMMNNSLLAILGAIACLLAGRLVPSAAESEDWPFIFAVTHDVVTYAERSTANYFVIENASDSIELLLVDGPGSIAFERGRWVSDADAGEVSFPESRWVWRWTPPSVASGESYTVKVRLKDLKKQKEMNNSFSVSILPRP